jgi:hypothetical protein
VSLEQVSHFFDWLRPPPVARAPRVFMLPGAAQAVENSTLLRKRAALAAMPAALRRNVWGLVLFLVALCDRSWLRACCSGCLRDG